MEKSNFDICESYRSFKEEISTLSKHNATLLGAAEEANKTSEFKGIIHTQLRGAIISMVTMWEAYIKDILEEALNLIARTVKNDPQKMFENGLKDFNKRVIKHSLDGNKKSEDDIKGRAADLCLTMMNNPTEKWRECVNEYTKDLATKLHNIIPIFDDCKKKECIDKKVIQILQPQSKKSVSVVMIKQTKFSILSSSETGDEERMSAIHDLTRLFYGARCVFAHGDHTKTFSQGGALYEFEKIKDKLLSREAHVYELYEKIRDGRR